MTSAGQEAVELAESAGLILDDWQASVLFDALGERRGGKWAALEVGLVVPRQNGKGAVLEARELAGLFLLGEQQIVHSSHEFKTSIEHFRRVLGLVQNTPDLERQVARVRTSHGEEGIELRSGARLRFLARSTGSGRGFSGDCVVLDEAFNLKPEGLSALVPTLSARENPQVWYSSSAPLPRMESQVLRDLCKRGRAGGSKRLVYIEFCAEDGVALDDREAWRAANPGLGIRINEDLIGVELETLHPEDFARERLGIWPDEEEVERVIPADDWHACLDARPKPPEGRMVFAVDVSPDRSWASIAVAGESKRGGVHVEVVDHRSGVGWLPDRLVELQDRYGGKAVVAKSSPAWSLELVAEVESVSVGEHAQACGDFFDAVVNHGLWHVGQSDLDAAVAGAVRRNYGDAWLWDRRSSSVDISPLVSATLAYAVFRKTAQASYDVLESVF